MAQGRIFIDWRLVCLAAIVAVGAPGQVVMGDLPVPGRLVLAGLGLLTWWYLFRCLVDTWGDRVLRRDGHPQSMVVPWLVFVVSFYVHGLLLGLAWRDCRTGEAGSNMVHVLVSASLVGLIAVLTWVALVRRPSDPAGGAVPAVLGVALLTVVLLWPAMAVWHGLSGSAGASCGPDGVPAWWPLWFPLG